MADQKTSADNGGIAVGGNFTGIANTGTINLGYTIEEHERILKEREQQIRADLERAHGAEKELLESKLNYIYSELFNLKESYQKKCAELEALKQELLDAKAENPDIAEVDFQLAFEALNRGDSKLADEIFEKIIKNGDKVITQTAKAHFVRGQIAYNNIEWAKALEQFKRASELAPENDIYLCKLSIVNFDLGNLTSAEKLFKDVITLAEKNNCEKNTCAIYYRNLATFYETQGNYIEAESLFKSVIDIFEMDTTDEDSRVELAFCYSNYAVLCTAQGNYTQAETLYGKAIEIFKNKYGAQNFLLAKMYNNLGETYYWQNKIAASRVMCVEAYRIQKKILKEDHPDFVGTYLGLAIIELEQRHFTKAEYLIKKSIEIVRTKIGPEHQSLVACFNNLGRLYSLQGKISDAANMHRAAISILEKQNSKDHPNLARSYYGLAASYLAQKNFKEADIWFKKSVEIIQKKLHREHFFVQTILKDYDKFLAEHKDKL